MRISNELKALKSKDSDVTISRNGSAQHRLCKECDSNLALSEIIPNPSDWDFWAEFLWFTLKDERIHLKHSSTI